MDISVPTELEPGWVLKHVWTLASRHNSISAVGNRTTFYRSSDGSLITIITELSWLPVPFRCFDKNYAQIYHLPYE